MTAAPCKTIVLGITGASGAIYALRLLQVAIRGGHNVDFSISPSGIEVLKQELGLKLNAREVTPDPLLNFVPDPRWDPAGHWATPANESSENSGRARYFHHENFMAPMASGSARSHGMVVCPCSGGTAAAIANGTSDNLICRAADVHLKERRKLILVPRETPLSLVHLENFRQLALAGAVVLPAMPGFYHGVGCVLDLVDFVVARICDQLEIEHHLVRRWGEDEV